MASADVTLGGAGGGFEVDTTERTATLQKKGGYLRNVSTVTAYVNVQGATVVTSQPTGAGGRTIATLECIALPIACDAFKFKTSSGTAYLELCYEVG